MDSQNIDLRALIGQPISDVLHSSALNGLPKDVKEV